MDVFSFRDRVVEDYGQFSRSFTPIKAPDLRDFVDGRYGAGEYWPSPLIQLNPSFVGEAASGLWWRKACCTRNAAVSSAGARTHPIQAVATGWSCCCTATNGKRS